MAGGNKHVEIEALLLWAYRDELPKRQTSSAEGIWDKIEDWAQRGGIDPGHGAAQRYPHFGLPHPDAERIERAVSALPDMVLDWRLSAAAVMGELSLLLAARDTLLVGTLRTAALVTMHARMGTRPDWREDPPHCYPKMTERGRPAPQLVGECRGKNLYSIGSYCPLRWEPSALSIAQARADYVCWHRGLTLLVETLQLAEHEALPPAAPPQPWNERAPARRIFAVGEHRGPALPLTPQRAHALAPKRVRLGSAMRRNNETA